MGATKQRHSRLASCLALAARAVAIYVAINLLREPPTFDLRRAPEVANNTARALPPPALVSHAEFRRSLMRGAPALGQLRHSLGALLFGANLCEVGRHNLATLAGRGKNFNEQSPFGTGLTRGEQAPQERAASPSVDGPALISERDGPVSVALKGGAASAIDTLETLSKSLNGLFKRGPRPRPDYPLASDLTGCLGKIRNQRGCGACYAFSLMALVEWHWCKQSPERQPVDFSEQYLVDCGKRAGLNGCKEGRLSTAKDFILFHGLKWEADHPYRAKEGMRECPDEFVERKKVKVKTFNWRRIPIEREIFEKTLDEQPILVEAKLPADIRSYSRGVHSGANCKEKMSHGLLVVGYGDEDGQPFWLIRNSYGSKWGAEGGYLRMSRNMPDMSRCFASAFVANFKFADLEDGYEAFYSAFKYQPPEEKREVSAHGLTRSLLAGV